MSDRRRALTERPIVLLTVWESEGSRERQGHALRYASEDVVVTDAAGRSLAYMGAIDPRVMVGDGLSTAPQSMAFTLPWLSDTLTPIDVDYSQGVGEVAILWTSGTGVESWGQRQVRITGPVSYEWGKVDEPVRIGVQDRALLPTGSQWPKGAEVSQTRFGDVATDTDRSRAINSSGLLPPICYAPVGSSVYAPCLCVADETSAVSGGADLVPRRYMAAQRAQASMGTIPATNEQFRAVHPTRKGDWMSTATDSAYREPLIPATDDDGGRYIYIEGDFVETIGVATFTGPTPGPATATVTAVSLGGKVQVGDQIRYTGDADNDWAVVDSIEGNTITLDRTYTGTGGTGGTLDVIRLPSDEAYQVYRILALGGDARPDGTPITAVIDVLIDQLRMERLDLPIAYGDLEAMRGRLRGIDVSSVLVDRSRPWDWCASRLFSLLPIRPYRANGAIRFAWVGTVTEADIDATIDLDTLGPAYRMEPVSYDGALIYPSVRLKYWWHIPRQVHRYPLLIDPLRRIDGGPVDSAVATGRSVRAYEQWSGYAPRRGARVPPVLEVETDAIEMRTSAGLVASWLLYAVAHRRQLMKLSIGREYAWCGPGTVLRVTQTGSTHRSQIWRVERREMSPIGAGSLLLSSVPS